jgi:hypothetical protein
MIKHVFIGVLNAVDEILAGRWYYRYHGKEVVRFVGPWLRRYETYKALDPPPESKQLGAIGGWATELWYSNVEDFQEADPNNRPYTFEAWMSEYSPRDLFGAVVMVPAMPTEDFLGKEPTPEEKTILRWYCAIKYPKDVPLEEGESWYCEVHSQEVKQQPGLLRYVSYRALENSPIQSSWHRVSEFWYENYDAWLKAFIESPPQYTPPPWTNEEPYIETIGNFIRYKPTVDFLKDNPMIP